jgi:hypothetical protein
MTADCLPHQAAPGEWCGHVASGASSYFDRLWKTGLSVHSAKHERYVLHVCKPGAGSGAVPGASGAVPSAKAPNVARGAVPGANAPSAAAAESTSSRLASLAAGGARAVAGGVKLGKKRNRGERSED